MSLILLISLAAIGLSLLCTLLIISAAVVSGRSSQRLAAQQHDELVEKTEALYRVEPPSSAKAQEHTHPHLIVDKR